MSRFRLFVDDSGNREYAADGEYGIDGKTLYFVYGGILINQHDADRLERSLNDLKRFTFGSSDVEIKSNWIRQPRERRTRYLERFGLDEEGLRSFVDDYYKLLVQAPLTLIAAVVNKRQMQEKYADPWYAPTVAYDVLLQRAALAVPADSTLAVTVDNIGGKTPNQNEYKRLLQAHHSELRARGSKLQKGLSFACLETPARFVFSEDSNLVQAADLIAYNVHRQFRDYGEEWEQVATPPRPLPMYEPLARVVHKFRMNDQGRIQGYGIVKVPLLRQVPWGLPRTAEENNDAAP